MTTQVDIAKQGKISEEMKIVAQKEGVDVEFVRKGLEAGRIIISKSNIRDYDPIGIGKGLLVKINANIGSSKTDYKDKKIEGSSQKQKDKPKNKIEPRKIDIQKEPRHKIQRQKSNHLTPPRNKIEPRKIDIQKEPKHKIQRQKLNPLTPSRNKIERPKFDPTAPTRNKIEPRKIDPKKEPKHKIQPRVIDPKAPPRHKIEPRHINPEIEPKHKLQPRKLNLTAPHEHKPFHFSYPPTFLLLVIF